MEEEKKITFEMLLEFLGHFKVTHSGGFEHAQLALIDDEDKFRMILPPDFPGKEGDMVVVHTIVGREVKLDA